MEAESRKDGKERKKLETLNKAKERMQPIESYFRNLKTKIESSGNITSGIFYKYHLQRENCYLQHHL